MQLINSLFGGVDQPIINFFLASRVSLGIKLFSAVSWLGEWTLIVPLTFAVVALFWLKNKKAYVIPFLTAVLGGEISGQFLKFIIQRPRPLDGLEAENTFSFPSGHALIAVTFYGFLIYYFWRTAKSQAQKYLSLLLGIILILIIGFSRLYLGVHYFSDVIASYLLGFIWLWIGIYLAKKRQTGAEL